MFTVLFFFSFLQVSYWRPHRKDKRRRLRDGECTLALVGNPLDGQATREGVVCCSAM